MASVTRKANGSYLITVSCGYTGDGKQKKERKVFYPTKTTPSAIKKEVDAEAIRFEQEVAEGRYVSGNGITFKKFYEDTWKPSYGEKVIEKTTYQDYCLRIDQYALPAFGNKPIEKIKGMDMQFFLNGIEKKGLKPATIKKIFASVNSVFRCAYKLGVITDNPIDRVTLPKIKKDTSLHYFTIDQAKTFLNLFSVPFTSSYKEHTRTQAGSTELVSVPEFTQIHKPNKMLSAFFTLAVYGGFRRQEICALTWKDVDFEKHTVSINKAVGNLKGQQIIKATKTVSSNRTVKIPSQCFEILHEWKAEEMERSLIMGSEWKGKTGKQFNENFIFIQMNGDLIDLSTPRQAMERTVERYNRSCKDEKDRLPLIRLHDLRHTTATILLSNGADIMTVSHRLGHSDASTTLDIYSHATQEADTEASSILERLLG